MFNKIDILNFENNKKIPNLTLKWLHDDHKSNWSETRKELGVDWRYFNSQDLNYRLNSYGYRTKELQEFDWKECVLFLGCSYIFGQGVHNKHTIPSIYEQITNNTTINMGLSGASVDTLHHNTHALIQSNYIPKKVIIMFPCPSRHLLYKDNKIQQLGQWSGDDVIKFWERYVYYESNYMTKSYLMQQSIINTWKLHNVEVHCFDRPESFDISMPIKTYPTLEKEYYVDKGRDGKHSGPDTNKNWTNFMIEDIND